MENTNKLAKIVGTASETSWTQAVSLDGFYAVLSLQIEEEENESSQLAAVGKELVISLEERVGKEKPQNVEQIRSLLESNSLKIPPNVIANFLVASLVKDLVSLGLMGKGKAFLARKGKLGQVLNAKEGEISTSSGVLEQGDIIFLATDQFQNLVSSEMLTDLIKNASFEEIAENIAPIIHGQDEAGLAAAILFQVNFQPSYQTQPVSKPHFLTRFSLPTFSPGTLLKAFRIEKKLLVIAALVLAVLGTTLVGWKFVGERGSSDSFAQVLSEANTKYDEGMSLLPLNREFAKEPLDSAKAILEKETPKNQDDVNKKVELLKKIEQALEEALRVYTILEPQVFFDLAIIRDDIEGLRLAASLGNLLILDGKQSALYALSLANKSYSSTAAGFQNPKYVAISGEVGFVMDDEGIFRIELKGKDKTLVVKRGDFGELGGLSAFFSNVYTLDTKDGQIGKFVPVENGEYSKRNYFSKTQAHIADGVSMAIDGSIYVLSSRGTIKKYLEGREDAFNTPELDLPFDNAIGIYTDRESEFVYVLDKGNKRVVVFKKDGPYEAQYKWEGIKDVRDFVVSQQEKKIFLLTEKKIFVIEIN